MSEYSPPIEVTEVTASQATGDKNYGLSKGVVSVLAGALGGVVSCRYACAYVVVEPDDVCRYLEQARRQSIV